MVSGRAAILSPQLPAETIANALASVLRSRGFRNAERRSNLLKYLADRTASGQSDNLKEFNIGVDVYGRDPGTYDPRIDPVVRVDISRLRRKLKEHYDSPEGCADPVQIELPKGSYAVVFHSIGHSIGNGPTEVRRHLSLKWIIACAALVVLFASATAAIFDWSRQSSPGARLKPRRVESEVASLLLKARARRAEGTRDAFEQAVIYLNEAIRRDPNCADAYADLAGVYAAAAVNFASRPLDYAAQAKAAATTALQLDPSSATAYAALGQVDSMILLNWKLGERELRQSIRLNPASAVVHDRLRTLFMAEGRFGEAAAEAKAAARLDPLAAINISLGLTYYMARDYDKALAEFIKARDLHPEVIVAHFFLGMGWEGKGDFEKALDEYRRCVLKMPEVNVSIAHALASMGKSAEAYAMLAEIEHPGAGEAANAFDVACVYAALGDRDKAFQWLEQSYRDRSISTLKVHPMLDPIRRDSRYAELLARTGLNRGI
jgi:tetratricopeptide (TPR) repeat protein